MKWLFRLMVTSSQYDICFNLSPAINYEVSFIDNKSGSEVFTISGRGCESGVLQKFKDALSGEGNLQQGQARDKRVLATLAAIQDPPLLPIE